MQISNYGLELGKVVAEIQEKNAKFVGLQFPEGLKKDALSIAQEIESQCNVKTLIFTDPCYGACDTKHWEGKLLGLDLIIHFGHTQLR